MTMEIPKTLLPHATYAPLRDRHVYSHSDNVRILDDELTDDMVTGIRDAAVAAGDKSLTRVMDAILAARSGNFDKSIPKLAAAPEIFLAYFRANLLNGWVYKRGVDGHLHAWLVTGATIEHPRNGDAPPYLSVSLVANGMGGGRRESYLGLVRSSLHFQAEQVTRKKVSDILTRDGIYIETPALRAEYDANLATYSEILGTGFAEQYRYTGTPLGTDSYRNSGPRQGRKVVHDIERKDIPAPSEFAASAVFSEIGGEKVAKAQRKAGVVTDEGEPDDGMGAVPTHFALRVFDLHAHDYLWVNAVDVERYVYDPTLRDKIVLPEDQRNLLDILTTDLDDFTGDVIEGKSAGNVVLCKGAPGVGKTLTAEVYSELIERPLYSIHSGNLGVSADDVRANLEVSFGRVKRWNAVLLLDEADVFVLERGNNIMQNAIVAEFLRTLEYFDGLMFMTTNRANNIDDAILSRAAAIIDYAIPDYDGIRAVWEVQARNQGTSLPAPLLDEIVAGFEHITPRDVKMLLRLALRVAKGQGVPLDIDIIARCAMFRGLHYAKGSRKP